MVSRTTWEEETLARIREARVKQQKAQELIKQAQEDSKFWGEYADILEKGLALDRDRCKIHPNGNSVRQPEHFRQQTAWESLCDIMSNNNGLLVVSEAVTILVGVGAFRDREHARNVIYSTIYSHKRELTKIRQGVYQLKDRTESQPAETRTKARKGRVNNGIKPVVKQLKDQNPQMTKKEVLAKLLETGFHFKGKDPAKSLTMAWVTLGYHNEGRQQLLPV